MVARCFALPTSSHISPTSGRPKVSCSAELTSSNRHNNQESPDGLAKLDTFTPSALCEARLEPAPRAREAAAAFSSNADEQLPDELLAELRTAAKPSQ